MAASTAAARPAWHVRYECTLGDVPAEALAELLVKLRLVADELDMVEGGSTLWPQLRDSELHLEAGGWRFAYSVPDRGLVAVFGAHQSVGLSGRPPARQQ